MSDPYASIADIDKSIQERLSNVLELRGSDLQQKEMMQSYLSLLDLPKHTKALEVGCGTGVISRYLSSIDHVDSIVGIDPSPVFIENAKELSQDISGLSFSIGDARSLDFNDESFDLVVFHTTLCHVPTPEKAISEAYRVLRSGGVLAIFDGDYVSVSVAIDKYDPLQIVVDKMISNFVENIWLSRQLPKILTTLGMDLKDFRSHGYSAVSDPAYMMSVIDRGIEMMVASGVLGTTQSEGLVSEAKRRVESGEFFGHISYISAIAQKT